MSNNTTLDNLSPYQGCSKREGDKAKLCFLFYPNFFQGGAEQLIMRVTHAMIARGCEARIGAFQCSEQMNLELRDSDLPLVLLEGGYEAYVRHLKNLSSRYQVRVITFLWPDYLHARSLQAQHGVKSILYVLQQDVLTHKKMKIGNLLSRKYGEGLERLFNTNRIVFMDEETLKNTFTRYGIDLAVENASFARIPFETNNAEFIHHSRQNGFQILSIARAEFPFKAYMFGLIELVKTLHRRYTDLSLTIVSYGSGFDDLQKAVKDHDFIELVGETPHDGLIEYYKTANLYVGMGTTLLEAANMYLPAVAVMSNTHELQAVSLFNEDPCCLTANNSKRVVDPSALVEQIMGMSESEYLHLCEATKLSLSDTYDCGKNVTKLIKSFDEQPYMVSRLFDMEYLARKALDRWRDYRKRRMA